MSVLVKEIAVTPAIINDGKAGPDALPDNPGKVFADSAYRGNSPDRYALSEFQESHTRQNSTAGPEKSLDVPGSAFFARNTSGEGFRELLTGLKSGNPTTYSQALVDRSYFPRHQRPDAAG
nr:hypothetical protein [Ensifer sp. IC4062]